MTTTQYAKDQPAGFTNRIEKVAIVGVSQTPSSLQSLLSNTTHRPRAKWESI